MSFQIASARCRSAVSVIGLVFGSATLLAGCSGADLFAGNEFFSESSMGVKASPRVTTSRNVPKGGGRYQVGDPYTVAGRTFVPREQPELDQTGEASWYGPAFHGRYTANGEIYDQYHLSGAHPTLPLPSYVRVTNLDNNASTIVRINDRGPFMHGRVVDLSGRAAEVLGFRQAGTANVRVQYIGPAPLEGDDTRFLTASINQLTPYEIENATTRMAYQNVQVAQAEPTTPAPQAAPTPVARPQTALDAVTPQVPANIPFQVLSYAGDVSTQPAAEPFGTPITMALGTFETRERARDVATAFAVLGAVDQATVVHGEQTATQLTLRHLREGVTVADAQSLAASLGLEAAILY